LTFAIDVNVLVDFALAIIRKLLRVKKTNDDLLPAHASAILPKRSDAAQCSSCFSTNIQRASRQFFGRGNVSRPVSKIDHVPPHPTDVGRAQNRSSCPSK